MEIKKLQEIGNAPVTGTLLAYTKKNILYEKYDSLEGVKERLEMLETDGLLEVHLFDLKKEYRAIVTRSKRFENGVVESIEDFFDNEETIFKEKIQLKTVYGGTLSILNHVAYDKNTGMAFIDTYRMMLGGE